MRYLWIGLAAALVTTPVQAQTLEPEIMVVCQTAAQARWFIEVDQTHTFTDNIYKAGCTNQIATFKRGLVVDFLQTNYCFFKIVEVYLTAVADGDLPRSVRYSILCSTGEPES